MKQLILSGALALALGLTSAANAQDPLFRIFFDESGNAGSDAAPHPGSGTLSYGNPDLAPGGGRLFIYGEFQANDQTVLSPNFDITIDGGTITGAWNYNGPDQDTLTGDRRWDIAAPNPLINPGGNSVSFTSANLTHMGLKNGIFADNFDVQHDNTRADGDTLLGFIDVEAPGAASVWLTVGQQGFALLGGGPASPINFGYDDDPVAAGDVGVRTQIADATIPPCTTDDECIDEDKCTEDRCDTSSGECVHNQVPGCCETEGDCPGKCAFCDTGVNECFKRPGCCTTDAQCGKCETCDLTTNTCNKDIPGCCTTDAQCPPDPKCFDSFCNTITNECELSGKFPGCCTSDAQCPPDPKCFDSFCNMITNECELSGKLPGCCTTEAQCPPDEKCRDSFCDLTTNTCELSGKFPGCCSTDAQCPQDDKCFDHFCDLSTNTCDLVKVCPPPTIRCPEPITLERGDRICRPAVDRWLDSAEAHHGCNNNGNVAGLFDVRIETDAPECGFPFDSTTEVTWTATDDCGNTSECSSTITIGKAERVDSTTKGSLLVMSKIEIKWDAAGNVTQDTFIDLTNDFPQDVVVQMYFINGDSPSDAIEVGNPPVLVERAHPGWNWVDCQIMLTKDQPTYWSALTGSNSHGGVCQPFTVLDPGSPPGRPDSDGPPGSRLLRGYVYAWAVNNAGEEIRWNHLKADVVLVNYEHTAAWEYNAYALTASCVDHGDQPSDCINFDDNGVCCKAEVIAGQLDSDAFQYAISFDKLLLDFYASGSAALSDGGATVQVDTDLTLHPVSADLRQDTRGSVNTKAHFDIWNQNEVRLSGTHRCISCWDQTLLSKYTLIANHFMRANLQTDKGKARINGESSNVCEENPGACDEFRKCLAGEGGEFATAGGRGGVPIGGDFFQCRHDIFDEEGIPFDCTVHDPLLGVSAKLLMFSGTASGRAYAGSNLVGQGEENARIIYDIIEPPDELIIGSGDVAPIEADVADNPLINRTPTKASKRGR